MSTKRSPVDAIMLLYDTKRGAGSMYFENVLARSAVSKYSAFSTSQKHLFC